MNSFFKRGVAAFVAAALIAGPNATAFAAAPVMIGGGSLGGLSAAPSASAGAIGFAPTDFSAPQAASIGLGLGLVPAAASLSAPSLTPLAAIPAASAPPSFNKDGVAARPVAAEAKLALADGRLAFDGGVAAHPAAEPSFGSFSNGPASLARPTATEPYGEEVSLPHAVGKGPAAQHAVLPKTGVKSSVLKSVLRPFRALAFAAMAGLAFVSAACGGGGGSGSVVIVNPSPSYPMTRTEMDDALWTATPVTPGTVYGDVGDWNQVTALRLDPVWDGLTTVWLHGVPGVKFDLAFTNQFGDVLSRQTNTYDSGGSAKVQAFVYSGTNYVLMRNMNNGGFDYYGNPSQFTMDIAHDDYAPYPTTIYGTLDGWIGSTITPFSLTSSGMLTVQAAPIWGVAQGIRVRDSYGFVVAEYHGFEGDGVSVRAFAYSGDYTVELFNDSGYGSGETTQLDITLQP